MALLYPTPEITIALVAGAVSLAGAGVAFVQARRTEQIKADASRLLEEIKAADERRRRAFEVATQESEPLAKALSKVWGDIQAVREVIYQTTAPVRCHPEQAAKILRSSVESINQGYRDWGAALSPVANRGWHAAKNVVGIVELLVGERGTGPQPLPSAPQDVDERLRELRAQLHDHQTEIQEARENLRTAYMRRILEAM